MSRVVTITSMFATEYSHCFFHKSLEKNQLFLEAVGIVMMRFFQLWPDGERG